MIQYQFDGNCNLVYTIIRKRSIFFNLLNLPTDQDQIDQIYGKQTNKLKEKENSTTNLMTNLKSMDGSIPAKEAEPGTLKATLAETPSVLNMTEKTLSATNNSNPVLREPTDLLGDTNTNYNYLHDDVATTSTSSLNSADLIRKSDAKEVNSSNSKSDSSSSSGKLSPSSSTQISKPGSGTGCWRPTSEWIINWKSKLPLQTIMRLLQVLVPQVEKICVDKGLTDESEILKFLQNGTLVGLLPVPHPILIRKYQPNLGTIMWFRTYMWGVIYLR